MVSNKAYDRLSRINKGGHAFWDYKKAYLFELTEGCESEASKSLICSL